MPGVKDIVSFETGLQVASALPPVIGLASRPALRAARCFEYWNLELLWSLKFVSLEFSFPDPTLTSPVQSNLKLWPVRPNPGKSD